MRRSFEWNGQALDLQVERRSADRLDLAAGDERHAVGVRVCDDGVIELTFGPRRARVHVRRSGDELWLSHEGRAELLRLCPPPAPRPPTTDGPPAAPAGRAATAGTAADGVVRAPTAAVVARCHVAEGDAVDAGARLLTLEAMKMEIPVCAPRAGVVAELAATPGAPVAAGAPLLRVR
jgi:biotin carboxyl carrier protein